MKTAVKLNTFISSAAENYPKTQGIMGGEGVLELAVGAEQNGPHIHECLHAFKWADRRLPKNEDLCY